MAKTRPIRPEESESPPMNANGIGVREPAVRTEGDEEFREG